MKILVLIRHAKSSWDNASMADFDRPLNARGLRDAEEMPRRLRSRIDKIDAFISSPAQRAKATAGKFIAAFEATKDEIIFDQGLYLAAASYFNQLIGQVDNSFDSVAVFSHNPGITDFANSLTTAIKIDNMPTCSIFAVQAAVDDWKNFPSAQKEFLFFDYPKLAG